MWPLGRMFVTRTSRRLWLSLVVLCGAVAAQVAWLQALPYSKASLVAATDAEASSSQDPLSLRGLSWHAEPYAAAPSLEPLRSVVREKCPALGPFETGVCLANLFATHFPHAGPRREFFNAEYDPAALFAVHMAGAPGHCVTRSGMLAAALLAAGIPARVTQLHAADGSVGHNVAEVWDAKRGWLLLDPSFPGSLRSPGGEVSAFRATRAAESPQWEQDPALTKVANIDPALAHRLYSRKNLFGALIVYPEPWLYTRVGRRVAASPFMGKFVVVGPRTWQVGWGQMFLQIGILACSLSLATLVGIRVMRRWARRPHVRRAPDYLKVSSPVRDADAEST